MNQQVCEQQCCSGTCSGELTDWHHGAKIIVYECSRNRELHQVERTESLDRQQGNQLSNT